jgi:tetratricopeptide (TPR) repeat protein
VIAESCFANKLEDAIDFLEEALRCAGDDCGYAAQLEIALALVLVATLDPARADPHLGRAIELARIAGQPALLAEATALSALARLFTGHGVDDEAPQQALALEDADRAVPFQMRPSLNVAQVYEFTGRLDRARELFVALRERVTVRGEESDLPWILVHLAVTSWLAGDYARAEGEADAALQAASLTARTFSLPSHS